MSNIANQQLPVCSQCKYFLMDERACSKFGEKNIITGGIDYTSVSECRREPELCGKTGVHFMPMTFSEKTGKQVKHILTDTALFFVPFFIGAGISLGFFGTVLYIATR